MYCIWCLLRATVLCKLTYLCLNGRDDGNLNETPLDLSSRQKEEITKTMTTSETSSATDVSQVVELPSTNTEDAEMAQISPGMSVSSGFRSGCMRKTIK